MRSAAFYIGNGYVLKLSANLGKLKNHIQISKSLENVGLSSATPVKTANGREIVEDGDLYFCLTKRLEGLPVKSGDMYAGDSKSKARFVGEIIGQLSLALKNADAIVNDVNIYETCRNWALPKAKECMELPDAACKEYMEAFGQLYDKLPKQIIHRDPNPGNILLSDGKWGFLDFELSEKNVRIFDPCYAATAILSESFDESDSEKQKKWIEIYRNIIYGYDSVAKLTDEEWKAVPYVILCNQLICVAWFSEQEKYRNIFETNKKMLTWLLTVFEKLTFS